MGRSVDYLYFQWKSTDSNGSTGNLLIFPFLGTWISFTKFFKMFARLNLCIPYTGKPRVSAPLYVSFSRYFHSFCCLTVVHVWPFSVVFSVGGCLPGVLNPRPLCMLVRISMQAHPSLPPPTTSTIRTNVPTTNSPSPRSVLHTCLYFISEYR